MNIEYVEMISEHHLRTFVFSIFRRNSILDTLGSLSSHHN